GGDQASYASFLARITPLLRRMVARRLGASEVEDVVQEVLISIHKARHTYDGKRPLMPWLVAIARFRISDHLRRHYAQMRHQTVDIDDFTDRLADVTETDDSNESIEDLLHDVPDKQKRILTLMHVEGYTAKEVGAKLNMNESAVKVAAHRAIKKIRERFGS
ncbi:MAG: sigma-70 family RNA polymerase sigma factor, partial [Rickettsiales bacterium]|nr:sigma-70 family RNA polymerase sigma factor [Rickettsiales bacterium]